MTTPIEHSLKARLRNIARERGVDASTLWHAVIHERFLERLALSPYTSHFVLKGGALLARYIPIRRHTQDLDFLVRNLSNELSQLQRTLEEVITTPLHDGFHFSTPKLRSLPHPQMKYPGARATMMAFLGNIRFHVSIDLSFGDEIEPTSFDFPLTPTQVDRPISVEIQCYSRECIFAEKLETAVSRAAENTRMKDYHDLYMLANHGELSPFETTRAITTVFGHRGTALELPLEFDPDALSTLQGFWSAHLRALPKGHAMPTSLSDVIDELNSWLCIHLSLKSGGTAET